MKRILITGANSYIGTSVEKYLSQWPEEYHVDTIDMVDGSWREKSFAGYDSVFHVAGIAHINTKKLDKSAQEKYWTVNAELPVEVAQKAKTEGVEQFVFLSSMSVYGEYGSIKKPVVISRKTKPNPNNIYGKSKLTAENGIFALQRDNFATVILRPPMIYGPGCRGNYKTLEKAACHLPFFPNIQNRRSMLHIDNLCKYIKKILHSDCNGVFFLQDDQYISTCQLVCQIAQQKGRRIRLTGVFNPILRFLSGRVLLVDKVFGDLLYDRAESNNCAANGLNTQMEPGE